MAQRKTRVSRRTRNSMNRSERRGRKSGINVVRKTRGSKTRGRKTRGSKTRGRKTRANTLRRDRRRKNKSYRGGSDEEMAGQEKLPPEVLDLVGKTEWSMGQKAVENLWGGMDTSARKIFISQVRTAIDKAEAEAATRVVQEEEAMAQATEESLRSQNLPGGDEEEGADLERALNA